MKFSLILILFLIVIIFLCGCTQTTSDNKPGLATDIPLTPVTIATTVTFPPATISAPPKDPIIGTWIFHIYSSWGKVDDEFIFLENNTWTRIITNVKSDTKKYTHATWIKNSAKNYTVGSHIFEYNITSDELTDLTQTANAGFEFIYKRTVEATDPFEQVTTAVLPSGLLDSKNFSYVVENLDTPVKAAQYTQNKFIFESHGKCTSYSPEEFFKVIKGDCKDYATFLSYLLAEHGYDAKIVAFKFFKGSHREAHVVTLFTDTDGTMKYATTPDVTKFREVNSVDDLLAKECNRLGVNSIANYTVIPAGSVDACVL